MAAKQSKVTLKSLQAEMDMFREEIKDTTEKLNEVKIELTKAKEEIKFLKEDGAPKSYEKETPENEEKCKMCDDTFSSKKSLKGHLQSKHPKKIQCQSCEQVFEKNCELEMHMKTKHEVKETFNCNKCGKKFLLKWRMKKHLENHSSQSVKRCHYYNNKKVCPYEELGCMFEHAFSGICRFGESCLNKLCPYEHGEHVENENMIEANEGYADDTLKEEFEKLTYKKQDNSKFALCDIICAAPDGHHKCFEEGYARFAGCDLTKYSVEYDDLEERVVKSFPCEKCNGRFEEEIDLRQHLEKSHVKTEMIICPVANCEYETKSVDVLIMHFGIYHKDLVDQQL